MSEVPSIVPRREPPIEQSPQSEAPPSEVTSTVTLPKKKIIVIPSDITDISPNKANTVNSSFSSAFGKKPSQGNSPSKNIPKKIIVDYQPKVKPVDSSISTAFGNKKYK